MQIKLFKQIGFDSRRDPIPEENPMRHDDGGAPKSTALQTPHDQLQEQQGCLGGPAIVREVREDACFLFSAVLTSFDPPQPARTSVSATTVRLMSIPALIAPAAAAWSAS